MRPPRPLRLRSGQAAAPTWRLTRSGLGQAALKRQKDQVCSAAHAELVEQVGHVELDGALSDIEFAGDFLVGKILEKRIENFLFAPAEIGDRVGFEAASLAGENGIDEAGKHRPRHPEASLRYQWQSARKLVAGFRISENALHTEAEKREAVGFIDRIPYDNKASIDVTLQNICEQRAGGLASGMRINDVHLSDRRLEVAQIGSQGGFELFGDDLELRSLAHKALKLCEHQRVRREQTDG